MGVNKATWYLLGLASGGGAEAAPGFKLGWQYKGYESVVKNIENTDDSIWTQDGSKGLTLSRDGTVRITEEMKEAGGGELMQVGVIFVFGWKKPSMCLGGKFDWIGKGEMDGSSHDLISQNVVKKFEDPVGKIKRPNYWFDNGAKPGLHLPSKMLKKTSGTGGVIVTVGVTKFCKVYGWSKIGTDVKA